MKHVIPAPIIPQLLVSGFVKELDSKEPIEGATLFVFNPKSDNVMILESDSLGNFETELEYDNPYVVKAMKDGYIYDCTPFRTPEAGVIEYRVPRDLLLFKLNINQSFIVENIYYDLDKWFIREDAKMPLDNLINIMNQYPIEAELSSHTDSRASHKYNIELSQKRAESAVEYIIANGISPSRITAKGYGETQLVNQCADGVSCTEEQHQANRRTEFKITSIDQLSDMQNPFDPEVFKVGDVISIKLFDEGFFSNCLSQAEIESNSIKKNENSTDTFDGKIDQTKIRKNKRAANNKIVMPESNISDKSTSANTYHVQVIAVTKTLDRESYFTNINDLIDKYGISISKVDGLNKYQIGSFENYSDASKLRQALISRGYKTAFIVKNAV